MRIAVDVDGVLIDLIPEFCRLEGNGHSPEEVTKWGFFEDWGVTFEKGYEIFANIDDTKTKTIDEHIPIYLERLNKEHTVYIVTCRNINKMPRLLEKFKMMGLEPGKHYEGFIIIWNHDMSKKLEHDFDVYIDDSPKIAEPMKYYPAKDLILFDQPWNQGVRNGFNIKRVKGWKKVMEEFFEDEEY